jgi:hypothetical protein
MKTDNRGLPIERLGKISGSECTVLLPERGDGIAGQITYAQQLASDMFWEWGDKVDSWQTEHGHLCEPLALNYYQDHFDIDVIKPKGKAIKKYYWISPDAINSKKRYGLDFKCPTSLKTWEKYLFNGIDKQQYHQAQMYMWGMGYDLWYVCAYLMETVKMSNNGEQYDTVPYEKRMIRVEVNRDEEWADRFLKAAPFVIKKRDEFYEQLKTAFK